MCNLKVRLISTKSLLSLHCVSLSYCYTENRANEERDYFITDREEATQHTPDGNPPIESTVYSLADNQYSLADGGLFDQEPEVYTLAGPSGHNG